MSRAAPPEAAVASAMDAVEARSAPRFLDREESDRAAALWLLLAVLVHAVGSTGLACSLNEMRSVVRQMRSAVRDALAQEIAIEPEARAPEPPPPPPEPEPEPEPPPPPPPPAPKAQDDPYETPPKEEDPYPMPPAPAEAAKVLTQEAPEAEKSAYTIASGEGDGPGYGMVAGAGIGNKPTFSRHAVVGGVPGGRGTALPPERDRSRPPGLSAEREWDCGFPVEADAAGINSAVVRVVITVRPDGFAQSVQVVSDPGNGFGRQVRQCAMRYRFEPGRDRSGRPTTATLGPIGIRFMR